MLFLQAIFDDEGLIFQREQLQKDESSILKDMMEVRDLWSDRQNAQKLGVEFGNEKMEKLVMKLIQDGLDELNLTSKYAKQLEGKTYKVHPQSRHDVDYRVPTRRGLFESRHDADFPSPDTMWTFRVRTRCGLSEFRCRFGAL